MAELPPRTMDEFRKLVEGEFLFNAQAWGLAKEYHDACDICDANLDLRWSSGRRIMQKNAFRVLQQVKRKAEDMKIPMEDVMHEIRNYRGPRLRCDDIPSLKP